MLDDGLMEKFNFSEVFGLHNVPGIPAGRFAIRQGAMMAATDEFTTKISGTGGHAAMPHLGIDPILVAAQLINALQSLVSRNIDPIQSAVLSVTQIHAGEAFNVIPSTATLNGTVRTLNENVRRDIRTRMTRMTQELAATFGATANLTYHQGYPATVNAPAQTRFAISVASEVAGAFIFLGNCGGAQLHQDTYDFNDEIIPWGCTYWVKLCEAVLRPG